MKEPREIIDHLSTTDALSILSMPTDSDKTLARRIAEMATVRLSRVDPEKVVAVLYDELDALEVEEVWDRAGKTRHGYVEPGEVADQMIEEVLDPFLEEPPKYQKIGMDTEANRMCMGLFLELSRFEHESTTEFKDWATDAPIIFAESGESDLCRMRFSDVLSAFTEARGTVGVIGVVRRLKGSGDGTAKRRLHSYSFADSASLTFSH